MSKTLAYIGGVASASLVGALGYKKVKAIRTGVDKAHDLAASGINKAFTGMKKVGEAGTRAVEAHEQKRQPSGKQTITVGDAK